LYVLPFEPKRSAQCEFITQDTTNTAMVNFMNILHAFAYNLNPRRNTLLRRIETQASQI
jgi:hypothetical protein